MPLLTTKIHIPRSRPGIVQRRRLVERLDAGLVGELTLISAPAGFGKSLLLGEWAAGCGPDVRVAWLSLDQGDNDPVRFLSYLIAAVQVVHPDAGRAALSVLQSPRPPSFPAVLSFLINDIAALPGRLVLILDDYHLITNQAIQECLTFLLDHLPQTMHLVIATRADPPLPLARLRARGQMVELRDADLSFIGDEAAFLLTQVMGLALSEEDVRALAAHTEGWAAGLTMAALSMRGRDDLSDFVAAFTGSHRYILDYLSEEVLSRQPQDVQEFLLETSILGRLSGSLCDAVTARDDSQEILQHLDAANLFVIALDDERRWYRYHHLFAQLLQARLHATQPDRLSLLHRRASDWYAAGGRLAEAIDHALAAGDHELGASLVEASAFAMMGQGRLFTLLGWLAALPAEVQRSRPQLSAAHAWALMYSGQLDAVEPWLQAAEADLTGGDQNLEGIIAAARAYVLASRGEVAGAIELASRALEQVSPQDPQVRAFTSAILSSLYRFRGDYAASIRAAEEAIAASRAAGEPHMAVLTTCNLAGTLIVKGQLHRARARFLDARKIAAAAAGRSASNVPFAGLAATGLAHVLREWNELAEAERLATEGVELSRQWGHAEVIVHGHVELARVLQARGDAAGALGSLQEATEATPDLASLSIFSLESVRAGLCLAQGDLDAAERWVAGSGLSHEAQVELKQILDHLTFCRVLIAQQRNSEAADLLSRLSELAHSAGAVDYEIKILLFQALVCQAQGGQDGAQRYLSQALALARPGGYVRVFVDEGPPMEALLHDWLGAQRPGMPDAIPNVRLAYVEELLAAFSASTPQPRVGLKAQALVEPLSDRELQVLRLVAAGLSNREIAETLILAIGTVKKHTNNIYGKLGVRNRTQAVLRAQELGLL